MAQCRLDLSGSPFVAGSFDPTVTLVLDELSIPKDIYLVDPDGSGLKALGLKTRAGECASEQRQWIRAIAGRGAGVPRRHEQRLG